jgi:polar amino acid transport system substrate-binding protein
VKRHTGLAFASALWFFPVGAAVAQERVVPVLQAVTADDNYPFDFEQDGKVQGLAVDIATSLAQRAGFQLSVKAVPWPRALKMPAVTPGLMLFAVVRTAERESTYAWIGPIAPSEDWLYKLRARHDIVASTMADASKYSVGDTAGSYTVTILEQNGNKVELAPSDSANCRKLQIGRLDFIVNDPVTMDYFTRSCGLTMAEVEKTVQVSKGMGYYIAFGKSTSRELISKLRAEFQRMTDDQSIRKIQRKWGVMVPEPKH